MRRRRWLVAGGIVAVVVAVVVAIVAGSDDSDTAAAAPRQSTTLQPVTRRTLATTEDVTGTVGYGTATSVRIGSGSSASATTSASSATASGGGGSGGSGSNGTGSNGTDSGSTSTTSGTGTITALPAVGTVIAPGGALAEVDGAPGVFLMVGTRPMWRTIESGISDGPDVQQVEATLDQLGDGGSYTTDETFTSGTASAIEAWQTAHGLDATGALTPSQIVFEPGAVRVASQVAAVGDTASGELLTVTGTTPIVHVDLDASLVGDVHPGDAVTLDLPDSTTVDGAIFSVGTATTSTAAASGANQGNGQSSSTTTVPVDIVVNADLSKLDAASVVVHLVTAKAENALAVPVKSLLALAEGGYAVTRERGGVETLVKVTPGTFAGGFVQVTGAVRVGDRVVTP